MDVYRQPPLTLMAHPKGWRWKIAEVEKKAVEKAIPTCTEGRHVPGCASHECDHDCRYLDHPYVAPYLERMQKARDRK